MKKCNILLFYILLLTASGEKYTAVYTYAAQYEDELSFEAGETVTVVNKDEADWWKGECNGKSGVFPSNYVEPLKCKVLFNFDFLCLLTFLSSLSSACSHFF